MARRFGYFFRETTTALRRNAVVTFAAIATVFISLFLLGFALLVNRQVNLFIGEWTDKVEVSVFLRDDINRNQIESLGGKIESFPEVQRVFFESKEQAFENARKLFRGETILEHVSEDAFPASYRVKLNDPEKFDVIRVRLAGEPGIERIQDERAILNRLFALTNILRTGVLVVGIVMLVAAAGLIGNTVRLAVFARRKEIGIMKLVGATNWFIRVPFLIEGVVQGVIGAGTAVLTLLVMRALFIDPLREQIPFTPWVGTSDILFTVPILFGAGIAIAAVASLLAMRRFLEV